MQTPPAYTGKSSPEWSTLPRVGASAAGISAFQDDLYYWDTEGKLFKWNKGLSKWTQAEGSVRQASVGTHGLWVLGKSTGQPYRWNAESEDWEEVSTEPLMTQLFVASGNDDVVAADSASESLYRLQQKKKIIIIHYFFFWPLPHSYLYKKVEWDVLG